MTVQVYPRKDTIQGGETLVGYSSTSLVTPDHGGDFTSQSIPAGWSDATTGSGVVRYRLDGTRLHTGTTASSTATLDSTSTRSSFDASMTVRLQSPQEVPSSSIDVFYFEFQISSTSYVRLSLRYDPNISSSSLLAAGTITSVGGRFNEGYKAIDARIPHVLRLIRHDAYASCFIDGDELAFVDKFDTTATGLFRLRASNGGTTSAVSVRLDDLSVSSNALIGPRFLKDKKDIDDLHFYGVVPSALFSEVGTHDVTLFGSWGSTTLSNAFEYTRPDRRTIGAEGRTRNLFFYDDAVIRD